MQTAANDLNTLNAHNALLPPALSLTVVAAGWSHEHAIVG
jgi:hypothetical protein